MINTLSCYVWWDKHQEEERMFCGNCGNQVPEGANVCPNCGTPVAGAPVQPEAPQADVNFNQTAPQQDAAYSQAAPQPEVNYGQAAPQQDAAYTQAAPQPNMNYGQAAPQTGMNYGQPVPQSDANTTIALVCGIVSIVLSILGGILFGVIPAIISVALGVVAVVLAININKTSPEKKGNAALVCGIIGLVFGVVFAAGCSICGCATGGYTCYGCVGASCKASSDISRGADSFMNILENYDYSDWDN